MQNEWMKDIYLSSPTQSVFSPSSPQFFSDLLRSVFPLTGGKPFSSAGRGAESHVQAQRVLQSFCKAAVARSLQTLMTDNGFEVSSEVDPARTLFPSHVAQHVQMCIGPTMQVLFHFRFVAS